MNPTNRRPVPGVRPGTSSEAAPWVAETLAKAGFEPWNGRADTGGFLVEGGTEYNSVRVTSAVPFVAEREAIEQLGDADAQANRMMDILEGHGFGVEEERGREPNAVFLAHAPDDIARPMHWQWSEQAGHAHCEDRHRADPRVSKTTDQTKVTCRKCRADLDRMAERRAKAEAEREAFRARHEQLVETVRTADTPEAAQEAVDAVRASVLAHQARQMRPGWNTYDHTHGPVHILEYPQETRTDDDRPCVMIRARAATGNVWLRYEESF